MVAQLSGTRTDSLSELGEALMLLKIDMLNLEQQHSSVLLTIAPKHTASARNLLHYLAMRKQDLRSLQTQLASVGLSSIGHSEAHALSSVMQCLT